MTKCIVTGCQSKQVKKKPTGNISLHCFPRSPKRIRQWLKNTGQKFDDVENIIKTIMQPRTSINYRMCSEHFNLECFHMVGSRKKLKSDAIPTIFCNVQCVDKNIIENEDAIPSTSVILPHENVDTPLQEIDTSRYTDADDNSVAPDTPSWLTDHSYATAMSSVESYLSTQESINPIRSISDCVNKKRKCIEMTSSSNVQGQLSQIVNDPTLLISNKSSLTSSKSSITIQKN
ncbi:THAP domain-containing protein 1-like [Bombina bombina]|uniref:THAP domain-containing protein 1-like n=1 Tax=Bombina bombina TaxID=8345 RepID=UPI00235A5E1C|nr:THAP domain-containing protein 1-like [Bombina bombina]